MARAGVASALSMGLTTIPPGTGASPTSRPTPAGRAASSSAAKLRPRHQRRRCRRIASAKVPASTVHGTRKACGSLLAALDVHPRVAMQILRHSKIAITMEIYTEVVSSATREALRKLGDQLGP